ncbi:MAG: hypothetical protein HZA49_00820 [Planctomycetes bacterium]|nr:hypothetical protein [Planctomycetota bacterium]
MKKILLIVALVALMGCDSGERIAKLEKEAESAKQELARKDTEIAGAKEEAAKAKLQLEQANTDLILAREKNESMAATVRQVEIKLANVADELGKDGLILPACLVGRSIVIYIKPYEDVQIIIGTVQKIQQGDKVIVEVSPTNQTMEVPFRNIIGYRMLK